MSQQSDNLQAIELLIDAFNKATGRSLHALPAWYFCDNEVDANDCANLVLHHIKTATTSSLFWFEHHNEALPKVGDLAIFTNWQGKPLGIIEITHVAITPYNDMLP